MKKEEKKNRIKGRNIYARSIGISCSPLFSWIYLSHSLQLSYIGCREYEPKQNGSVRAAGSQNANYILCA